LLSINVHYPDRDYIDIDCIFHGMLVNIPPQGQDSTIACTILHTVLSFLAYITGDKPTKYLIICGKVIIQLEISCTD